jgi:TonB family protein
MALRHSFEKQLLSLRIPYTSTTLKFDSDGKLRGKADVRPWTTRGVLRVKKLSLKAASLEIEGERVILVLGIDKAKSLGPVVTNRPVHIAVEFSQPPVDEGQVRSALSNVFNGGDLQQRFAEYWYPLVDLDQGLQDIKKQKPDGIIGIITPNRPVYYVVPNVVTPPQSIYTPDPDYSANARKERVQGDSLLTLVVSENGLPEIMKLERSLEQSLDIRALLAISEWRFKPATKDGKPVAVLIQVKMTFHLY